MRSTWRWNPVPHPAAIGLALCALVFEACGSPRQPSSTSPTLARSGAGPTTSAPVVSNPTGDGTSPVTAAPVESNPPGDIPDTTHYVAWSSPDGKVQFNHPEGWAQTAVTGGVRFSDKLNSVTLTTSTGAPPTVAGTQSKVVPALVASRGAVQIMSLGTATLPAGRAVRLTWRVNSAPDPVTSRVYRDEVVTYLVGVSNRVVRMDLSGAVGSDNVDPYRTISDSLKVA